MKIQSLKNINILLATFILFGIASLQSCNKKDYTKIANTSVFENSKTVKTSVYGIVQDESGTPVQAALVKTGSYTTVTDNNGLFFFNNITTPSNVSTMVVSKDGYFNGSRSLSVNESDKHVVKITMMAKSTPEVFEANNGGTVNFTNGLSITFPANAIVNKANGNVYTGQVYVYAKTIDPTTITGREMMPGDLRGIDVSGIERGFQSFGMMVAELYDINGNALQIATNAEATLGLTVPNSMQNMAPANIMLWSYDELKGIWVAEGSAVLQGNTYVGKVKHFSFWDCGAPLNAINLQMILHDQNGNPLQNVLVKLTNTANLAQRYGVTSATGWVGGPCYSNAVLTLEVFDNNICGNPTPIYTTTITTGATNMNLGIITVNLALINTCSFTAIVQDCLGNPITNGCVYIQPLHLLITPNALGQISYSLPCIPPVPITLIAYDFTNLVNGSINYTLLSGPNNIGIITACGNVSPFINVYFINNVSLATATKVFVQPVCTLSCFINGPQSFINGGEVLGSSYFSMTVDGFALGSQNIASGFVNGTIGAFTDNTFAFSGVNNVNYSAFPAFPGDVQGSFSINLIGSPSGDTYTATGTFRVPRTN